MQSTKLCSHLLLYPLLVGLTLSAAFGAQQKVYTVAGGAVGDGGPATGAALNHAEHAAYDGKGNLYIADYFAHRIRKVNKAGVISTIAGNGISGYSGDGGQAKSAKISFPTGLIVDPAGNILFSDDGNSRVRKIDTSGIITTIAGNGIAGYSGDGGPATSAELNAPWGLAVKGKNLYIADSRNNVIRKIDGSGNIHTVAGNGVAGFGGDGGPATQASLSDPVAVFADSSGDFYIADWANHRARRVDSQGTIITFAGNGNTGCSGDGGPATSAALGSPNGFQLAGGSLLIAVTGCGRVRSVDLSSQIISTVAGSSGGFNGDGLPPLSTMFAAPHALSFDKAGELTLVDTTNDRVRAVDAGTQTVKTVAGGFLGDGGPSTNSSLHLPTGIGFDGAGNLYIADSDNHRVRKVDTTGTITTSAGMGFSGYSGDGGPASQAMLAYPQAVTGDPQGNVFLVDQSGVVLRKVDTHGTISTLPNPEPYSYYVTGLATDGSGNLFAVDDGNCVVWKIVPSGTATIVAGVLDQCGYNGDGIPATQAWLAPWGIAVDGPGNLYIADYYNNRIRKVNTKGKISTIAGDGTCAFTGDGGPAKNAELCPYEVAFDSGTGAIYITDIDNSRVRAIDNAGIIRTVAGTGSFKGYNGDGLPAKKTNFDYLWGIAVSPLGVVDVSDYIQSRVRTIK